jgi:hypothetical protein
VSPAYLLLHIVVADRHGPLVGAVIPQSSPASRPRGVTGKITIVDPATHHHLHVGVLPPMHPHPRAIASSPRAILHRVHAVAALLSPSLRLTRYLTRSSVTKPHVARSAGRADTAESTPSSPLCSTTRVRVRSRVGTLCWRPSMHYVDTWIPPSPADHLDASVRTTPSSCALHATPIAAAPLCRVSARSLYRRTDLSPPFLSPGAARVAFTQCMTIKGGSPVASRLRQCLVRLWYAVTVARLYFSPCCRCQATSPLLSPHAHVQELHQSLELHPNPKNRHLHRC